MKHAVLVGLVAVGCSGAGSASPAVVVALPVAAASVSAAPADDPPPPIANDRPRPAPPDDEVHLDGTTGMPECDRYFEAAAKCLDPRARAQLFDPTSWSRIRGIYREAAQTPEARANLAKACGTLEEALRETCHNVRLDKNGK